MVKKIFVGLCAILILACAEKKYLVEMPSAPTTDPSKATGSLCDGLFEVSKFCISVVWETRSTETSFGSMLVKVWRPNIVDQSPVPMDISSEMKVVLWMPSMSHGSSPVTVQKMDVGTFRASRVFFSMPGEWEIRVHMMNGSDEVDKVYIPFRF